MPPWNALAKRLSLQRGHEASDTSMLPTVGCPHLILQNPDTGEQVTIWTYGSTLIGSQIARSDLPPSKTYPTGESESQTYNRQSDINTLTDPNGTVHTYRYDRLGRITDDSITTLGVGVDNAILRLSISYNLRGRVEYLTSANNPIPGAGFVVNQVKREYNGFNCLTVETQARSGIVTGAFPKVQYTCTAAADNILRRTAVVYPNGRTVNYEYGDTQSADDVLNRVQSAHDDDLTALAEYRFMGVGTPSVTTLLEPGIQRRWKKLPRQPDGDAGDPYTGYDRFGRVEQTLWRKTESPPADLIHVQWGYSRASLKNWRKDIQAPNASNQDQHFDYDNMNQVRLRRRGLLNTNCTAIGGIPTEQEAFTYDETGNWIHYQKRDAADPLIDQIRVNNKSNQIVSIDGDGTYLSYDKNGNMRAVPAGGQNFANGRYRVTWDAWNRLRTVTNIETSLVLYHYLYDAPGRRILTVDVNEELLVSAFYDDSWRVIEHRRINDSIPFKQYVWHPSDRWELTL